MLRRRVVISFKLDNVDTVAQMHPYLKIYFIF